jgi:hypothetical protein
MCAIFQVGKILGRVLVRKEKGSVAKDGEIGLWAGFRVEKGVQKHRRV